VHPLDVILIGCDEDVVLHVRRELMKDAARIEAEFRDVGETLAHLRPADARKRVIIVQLKADDFGPLRPLRRSFPDCPVVLLVSGGEDRILLNSAFLTALRMGASQIVGLPFQPREFQTALDRIRAQFALESRGNPKVIAVAGVTGGCGATSLAINLGQELAHLWNKRCILVDLSLKLGAVASHLNIEPPHTIQDLLSDARNLDEALVRKALVRIDDDYELLAGPDRVVADQHASAAHVRGILEHIKPLCDVIVLDLPCTYDDFYFETLAGADHVVLVGEQKVPSIRALKLVHDLVDRKESPRTEHLVINRFNSAAGSFSIRLLVQILGVSRLHTITRDESAFRDAGDRGCTLRSISPRCVALAEIDVLAGQLLPGEASADGRPRDGAAIRGGIPAFA
jgi:pilus assembly protein CpaE